MNPRYKFLIAGGSNTAITFALYALLVSAGLNYNIALTVTYLLGIVLGFLINRLWTFASVENATDEGSTKLETKSTSTQFLQYLTVYALIFIANFLILNLLVRAFNFNPIPSQLVAIGFSTICSYFLQRSWVFKH